jgi:hypothetical protein
LEVRLGILQSVLRDRQPALLRGRRHQAQWLARGRAKGAAFQEERPCTLRVAGLGGRRGTRCSIIGGGRTTQI